MPAATPEDLSVAFAAAINARDLPAALDLWSEDPAIVQPDGSTVRGRESIASALQALVDNGVTLEISVTGVFAAGAVATAVGTLKLSGSDGDGQPYEQSSQSVVVYTRGADGWRIAIDAPWGLPAP